MTETLIILLALILGISIGGGVIWLTHRHFQRERFIREYVFSHDLLGSIQKTYPMLAEKDWFLVARALRVYFLIHLRAQKMPVAMPSKVVDVLWHEFILDTKAYHEFCGHAFGAYFHHIPAAKMRAGVSSEGAMRRTWRLACLEENIAPQNPTRLPLLFSIDAKLGIPDGNTYALSFPPRKQSEGGDGSCGGFACSGGGLAGGHSSSHSHSHSDGDAGGSDGGSSCGGGGCGGGD